MANSKNSTKSDVSAWESVASYVVTFPHGDNDRACDVEVQIGSVTGYTVSQLGLDDGEIYETREDAQEEADRLNAEADEECGVEIVGDGAACVGERTVWFICTRDDAGGSDDAPDTEYSSEEEATAAAEEFAAANDEGDGTEDAEDYLNRQTRERAGEQLLCGFSARELVDGERT